MNFEMFPALQECFSQYQPPALFIWSKLDVYFDVAQAHCHIRVLPKTKTYILEGGPIVLEINFEYLLHLIGKPMESKISE